MLVNHWKKLKEEKDYREKVKQTSNKIYADVTKND